jgi:antirestriction protein ArdC
VKSFFSQLNIIIMSNNNDQKKTVDVYELVNNRINELLEAGTIPWRKPWTSRGLPKNAISKRAYRGINLMLLNVLDFEHNLFLTWQQIKGVGGSVLKGEKGLPVVFTKMIEVDKAGSAEKEKKSILRYYNVFNIAQCKDLPENLIPKEDEDVIEPLMECLAIVECMQNKPKIVHKKPNAFYVPCEDYINMPKMKSFKSNEDYFGVLYHELIHSTGHCSRLNRKEICENPAFGSEPYSLEELTAEMGACYLKSFSGLPIADMANSAAYIKGWLEKFKGDKRILIRAASRSQQSVEYILNPKVEESVVVPEEELVLETEMV